MYNEDTNYQLIIVSNANHEVLKNLAFILYASKLLIDLIYKKLIHLEVEYF